jgi:hypothetical protein
MCGFLQVKGGDRVEHAPRFLVDRSLMDERIRQCQLSAGSRIGHRGGQVLWRDQSCLERHQAKKRIVRTLPVKRNFHLPRINAGRRTEHDYRETYVIY